MMSADRTEGLGMKQNATGALLIAVLLPILSVFGFAAPAQAQLTPPLQSAVDKMIKDGSYHFEMTMTAGATTTKSTGDVGSFSPIRMRITTDMGPQGTMQMVVLPPSMYMKIGSAGWKKTTGDAGSMTQMDVASMMRKQAGDYTVSDLGMQSRDGAMLHAYRINNTKLKSISTVFLDGSGRMARFESKNVVMRFSNFGAPMNITAPM
jgi:hypothetical protein